MAKERSGELSPKQNGDSQEPVTFRIIDGRLFKILDLEKTLQDPRYDSLPLPEKIKGTAGRYSRPRGISKDSTNR